MKIKTSLFSFLPIGFLLLFFLQEKIHAPVPPNGGLPPTSEPCGAGHLHQHLLETDTAYEARNRRLAKDYRKHMAELSPSANHTALYTLPLVVHIIHDNGPENIPDAQVIQGVKDLNDAYANVGYYDQGTGVDVEIQFCLAKQDPDGNLTTGINRVQSPLTVVDDTNDLEMKNLSRWDPLRYINVWIVRNANGYAGYAYLPGAHGAPFDGIVQVGDTWGLTQVGSTTSAHEMGHYLGLYHTWQGGCTNDDCLADGDEVCDTPPDQSTAGVPCGGTMNTCSTDTDSGPFTTDQNDQIENYMDYSSNECKSMFTQGQKERMLFFLENVRFSLFGSAGCTDPCTSDIMADFSPSSPVIFSGESVDFTNNSQNATGYDWWLDGTPFSNADSPSLTFDTPGEYQILLIATNADPNCVSRDTATIEVRCAVDASFGSATLFPDLGQTVNFVNTSVTAPISPPATYEWLVNGTSETTDTDFSFNFNISGTYEICLKATVPTCEDLFCQTFLVFDDSVGCESTFMNTFGSVGLQEEGWVVTESDNGGFFLAGEQGDQTVILKITPLGTLAWTRAFDFCPQDDVIHYLGLDSDGFLVGSGSSKTGPSSSGPNFVFRYDHLNDQLLWVKNLDFPDVSRFFTILEKGMGENFLITGQVGNISGSGCDGLIIEVDRTTGNSVWQKRYDIGNCETFRRSILVDGDIVMAGGITFNIQIHRYRSAMSRLDLDGNEVWSRVYPQPFSSGNAPRTYGRAVVQDGGSLILAADGDLNGNSLTNTTAQLYAAELNGNLQWAKDLNIGGDNERVTDLVNLPDGYLLLGDFASTSGQGQQIFLVKTDNQGEVVWSRQYGGTGDELAGDILVNNGFILLIGQTQTGGENDIFFAKLQLDGLTLDPCDQINDVSASSSDMSNADDNDVNLIEIDENYDLYDFAAGGPLATVLESGEVCGSLCTEDCDNGVDDDGNGYVDCYDDACDCNPNDCLVNELEPNFAMELDWESTEDAVAAHATPMVANLNPQIDRVAEIIAIVANENIVDDPISDRLLIFKGDGSNADSPAELPIGGGGYDAYGLMTPCIGDVNRDGIPELIITCADRRLRVYGQFNENANPPMMEMAVSTDLVAKAQTRPYLADFNADGITEIYVGAEIFRFDFTQNPPGLVKQLSGGSHYGQFYVQNYELKNASPVAADLLEPVDCNGDPDCNGLELVAGRIIYSVDLQTNDGDGFEIKIQRDLNAMQSQFDYRDGYTAVADVDLDGVLDVIVSSGANALPGVYIWNKDGPLGWFPHAGGAQEFGSLPTIANIYDDTANGASTDLPEIMVTGSGQMYAFNLNAAAAGQPNNAWWTLPTDDGTGLSSPTVFDFDGNGTDEIVYRGQDNLRIIYGGNAPFPAGVDAERNWSTAVTGSPTGDEHPVVADVDGDRQAEIVVAGYTFPYSTTEPDDLRSRLRIFQADLNAGGPWMSARPIWNQYNYFGVNINDDLSLPVEQQLHHLELPSAGSGYRPLHRFVAQLPLLDNDFQPYLPVPDATVQVDTAICAGDSVSLLVTVCNVGSAPLAAETPVAFYLGDPTASAVAVHHVGILGNELAVDSCATVGFLVPAFANSIFATANDDGSGATPFDLGSDFPVTSLPECEYENNLFEYDFDYTPPPPPDLGPDFSFCINGVFTLDAGPGWTSYRWHDNSFDQTFTGFMPGTYWVEVSDGCGNVFSDTISITEDTAAQFDLGPDEDICPGDVFNFNVPGFVDYQWVPGLYLDCDTCASVTATVLESVVYALIATDADGCVAVDSIELTTLTPTLFDTVQICFGESAVILGNVETMAGTYFGQIPGPGNCDTLLAVTLEIYPEIELEFTAQDACEGQDNGSISVDISFGEAPFEYAWSSGEATPEITGLSPNDYALTVTDADGCTATGLVAIGQIDENSVVLETEDASCFGERDGRVRILEFTEGTRFSFDGLNFTQDSLFVGIPAADYILYVEDPSGCVFEREITIGQPNEIIVNLPADTSIQLGDSVRLNAQVNTLAPLEHLWSPVDGLSCPGGNPVDFDCPDPWAAPFASTLYSLTVFDENGCMGEDEMQMEVLRKLNVYVPNGFSPNGDGINDFFTLFAGTGVRRIRRFLIFDRWGEMVFENYNFPPNDPTEGWDGMFNREALNPAVFIWFAEVELVDGAVELMEGDVALVR